MKRIQRICILSTFMLVLTVLLTILPANTVSAADKFTLKCEGDKQILLYAIDEYWSEYNVYIVFYKNGKKINSSDASDYEVKWKSSNKKVVKIVEDYGARVY